MTPKQKRLKKVKQQELKKILIQYVIIMGIFLTIGVILND